MSHYTKTAQSAAKAVLGLKYTDPKTVLLSMAPFAKADDIPGCNLVLNAWMSVQADIPAIIKFARADRANTIYAGLLDWLKSNLIGGDNPRVLGGFDMTKEDIRAKAWLDENRVD